MSFPKTRGAVFFVWCALALSGCLFKKVFDTPDMSVLLDLSVSSDLGPDDFAMSPPDLTVIACTTNAQCTAAQPICRAQVCAPCEENSECMSDTVKPRCDRTQASTRFGQCVACLENGHCGATTTPVCGTDRTCRGCLANSECTTNVCKPDGACATEAEISYVDNRGMLVVTCQATTTHIGTKLAPYCDFSEALNGPTRKWIIGTGHANAPYGPISMTMGSTVTDVVIFGPGRDAADPVQIQDIGTSAISLSTGTMELRGVVVGPSIGFSSATLISCSNAEVRVYDSLLQRAGTHAVRGNTCATKIERTVLRTSGGSLLYLSGATSTILNNFFDDANEIAIRFDGGATGTFRFNTVTRSGFDMSGDQGGANCGNSVTLESSIFNGNNHEDNGPGTDKQFQNCTLANVVTEFEAATPGVTVLPIDFVNAAGGDFHLSPNTANNLLCCIDRATNTTALDVDGEARPKGTTYDVGADEVQ